LVDQLWQITHRNGVVGNVRGDDFGRQRQQFATLVRVVHLDDPAVTLISKDN
jgi:hypothetical protein